jgi:BirA family biotin operon repressor/biotin-[acetyl-CoA-carboxylase] ligase
MDFPLSRQIAQDLTFVAETGSTNADLVANFANAQDFSVLVAGFQTAGRGRSGRDWLAPAGSSLFVSVLLKPSLVAANRFSWIPLLAGLAMAKTVAQFLPNKKVSLKWPNDVLVESNKVSGVLSELLPDLSGVVVGAGLNILQTKAELPIEAATSLVIEGNSDASIDAVLAGYLQNLKELYESWVSANGDAVQSGLTKQVIESCSTLGLSVKAILPGEQELLGKAVGIDNTGRLILQPDSGAEVVAVAAGDIVHLRHN